MVMFPNVLMACSLHLQLDHVTYKQFSFVLVITSPQIKNFQEPHRQVNHKTAHNNKVLVVSMFKRLTDSSIPVLNILRKLRSNRYRYRYRSVTIKTDLLAWPTVHERYDLQLSASDKQVTP